MKENGLVGRRSERHCLRPERLPRISASGARRECGNARRVEQLAQHRSNDGCPILNPYDGSLYMPRTVRAVKAGSKSGSLPQRRWLGNAGQCGPAINTTADEFCPTPARGNRFFFVRRLSAPTLTSMS